ncbi:transaldolase family protein [Christensenellaceae bacterium OttesenSCG-928-K19]|nr:transaldolase family protein [Christensenellaceae bacterium OttesenSCG-928-K19]
MAETYLEWLNNKTQTRWWHDSGNPDEIDLAITRGAKGVTTNPVLTYRTFEMHPEFWKDKVAAVPDGLDFTEHAEALLKLMATYAASLFQEEFEQSGGMHGLALGQLNPAFAGDYEQMLAQARRVHSWAPNIAVKLPSTHAGVRVIEQIAAEGIPICATLNVTVAQALAVAQAYERGKKKAVENGIRPALCLVVQQVGRLDDYLRDVAKDREADVSEDDIIMAGLAVAKRSYQIFEDQGYSSVIMPAGLRGSYHMTEMAGAKVTFTINTRIQDMILEEDPPREERINLPVDKAVIKRLQTVPEFCRAYEPDGIAEEDFITYGVVQKLLSQFMETGWAPLEVYGTDRVSPRWI